MSESTVIDKVQSTYDWLRLVIAEEESRVRFGAERKAAVAAFLDHYDDLCAFKANIIQARKKGGQSRSQKKLKSAARTGSKYGGRKRRLQIYAGILNLDGKKSAYYVTAHDKAELQGFIEHGGGNIDEFRYVKDSEPIGLNREALLSSVGNIVPIPRGF